MCAKQIHSVLTGDIVRSGKLNTADLEAVRAALGSAVTTISSWDPDLVYGSIDFFRGDSWQLVLGLPDRSLRVAVYLRAALLATGITDTRLVIGLGGVENLSPGQVSLSTGEAFTLSGSRLDKLGSGLTMDLALPAQSPPLSGWVGVGIHFCDLIIRKWTQRQAELVLRAMDPRDPTQDEISRSLNPPISQQAVAKILSSARWSFLNEAIQQFEKTAWESLLERERL